MEAKPEHLIGDRAYDSDGLDDDLKQDEVNMIAPHCSTRKLKTQDRILASFGSLDAQPDPARSTHPSTPNSWIDRSVSYAYPARPPLQGLPHSHLVLARA
jgi:hypothetical protein